jgi:DNA-binding NarL/FixJ family response regulator
MAVMNGLEAARTIGSIAPKTAVVLFTVHSSDHLVKDAQEVGIPGVISKLEEPATLLATIENIASNRRGQTK